VCGIDNGFEDREGHQAPFTLRCNEGNAERLTPNGKRPTETIKRSNRLLELFNRFDDSVEVRPFAGIEFGMEEFAIGANLEGAAARWDERKRLDALAELKNFGRQTDGPRRVVSNNAIFDRHLGFHQRASPFRRETIGAKKCGQAAVALRCIIRIPTFATIVDVATEDRLTITRRRGCFPAGLGRRSAGSPKIGDYDEQLHHWRLVVYAKQWRHVDAGVASGFPIDSRADYKAVIGCATTFLVAKAAELTLDSCLKVFRDGGGAGDRFSILSLSIFIINGWSRRRRGK
jgi:hypothetical protein